MDYCRRSKIQSRYLIVTQHCGPARPFTLRASGQELISPLSLMRVPEWETSTMDSIIYLVGLVVVIMFVLSLLGLR